MTDEDRLSKNFILIKERIKQAAVRANKPADSVEIIVASKYTDDIEELAALEKLGVTAFGENRLQSLEGKHNDSLQAGLQLKWHFIGHIQSNKARRVVQLVDLIQSVDSIKVAEIINGHAAAIDKRQKVLLQLKVSDEPAKTGFTLDEISDACAAVTKLANLSVAGLMVIPPIVTAQELISLFRLASNTLTKLQSLYNIGDTLSMGMSGDFELAIQEGANMVRIGSAIWR